MRLDDIKHDVEVERSPCCTSWEVWMRASWTSELCGIFTTRREAERHAARIRKALKGESK